MAKQYGFRYLVEPWNKPAPDGGRRPVPGIRVMPDNFGYADAVFIASVLREAGKTTSVILLDSDGEGGHPSREMLELVRDQIDHHLKYHTEAAGGTVGDCAPSATDDLDKEKLKALVEELAEACCWAVVRIEYRLQKERLAGDIGTLDKLKAVLARCRQEAVAESCHDFADRLGGPCVKCGKTARDISEEATGHGGEKMAGRCKPGSGEAPA